MREIKDTVFPRIRLFAWQLQNWRAAVNVLNAREGGVDGRRITFTSWVEDVLNAEAEEVFARHKGSPSDAELLHRPMANPLLPRK